MAAPSFEILAELGFVLSSASACLSLAAIFLRFADKPRPGFAILSENAYGMYLVHYVFVTWLQYALLGVALLAIAKGHRLASSGDRQNGRFRNLVPVRPRRHSRGQRLSRRPPHFSIA